MASSRLRSLCKYPVADGSAQREGRTGISNAPDEFDDASAAGALCALLHDLLGCGEGVGDAAAASYEHSSREAGDDSVPWTTCVKGPAQ